MDKYLTPDFNRICSISKSIINVWNHYKSLTLSFTIIGRFLACMVGDGSQVRGG